MTPRDFTNSPQQLRHQLVYFRRVLVPSPRCTQHWMPEAGNLKLDEREIAWEESKVPKKVSRADDEPFIGA